MTSEFPPESSTSQQPVSSVNRVPWTMEEDQQLCHSWLSVSTNPVKDTDQKVNGFWVTVHDNFYQSEEMTNKRTVHALNQRWQIVNTLVSKFCACYKQISDLYPNGNDDKDILLEAFTAFVKIHRKKFDYLHCYAILGENPLWKAYDAALNQGHKSTKKKEKKEVSKENETEEDRETPSDFEHPLGKSQESKKRTPEDLLESYAKRFEKEEEHDSRIAVSLEKQTIALEEKNAVNLRRNKLEQDKHDKDIMMIDLENVKDPLTLEYLRIQRERIMTRLRSEMQ